MTVMVAPAYGVGGTAGGGGAAPGPGSALTVSVSPLVANGARSSSTPVTVTSENVTLTITGGSGVYTIAWAAVSTPSGTWTITNPTGAVSRFSVAAVASGASFVGTFRAVVSDGATSVTSATVEVDLINTGTV